MFYYYTLLKRTALKQTWLKGVFVCKLSLLLYRCLGSLLTLGSSVINNTKTVTATYALQTYNMFWTHNKLQ